MKIYIMRHGEAEHFAASDSERALTAHGIDCSISVAKSAALNGAQEIDKVLVSLICVLNKRGKRLSPILMLKVLKRVRILRRTVSRSRSSTT